LILILTLLLISTARADHSSHHQHHHHNHDRRSNQPHASRNVTSSDSPETMLKNALAVLAHVNKERVENPNFNNYTSREPGENKVRSSSVSVFRTLLVHNERSLTQAS
jgi:hypothetical protein